jgi:pimeloyl-ACP methyl ester carboxylesterase
MRILFLIALMFLASCSAYRMSKRHVARKVENAGLSYHTIRTGDYTIGYWDSGSDKPVLLMLHGFGTDAQFNWYKQVNELGKYRLILPDLLYFGKSTTAKENYSVMEQVRAMQSLVKELNLQNFYLCGFSYGGLVAAELARIEPEKVQKLVLSDAPVKYFSREVMQPALDAAQAENPADLLVPEDAAMLKKLLSVLYVHPPRLPESFYKDLQKNVYAENEERYRKIIIQLEKESAVYESRDYRFTFPVLLIWGEEDRLVPKSVGISLEKHIGTNASYVSIPNTAHVPNIEAPHEFNKLLLDFLKKETIPEAVGTISHPQH